MEGFSPGSDLKERAAGHLAFCNVLSISTFGASCSLMRLEVCCFKDPWRTREKRTNCVDAPHT